MIKNQGFTLLELLISLALVAVLLTGVTGLGARFVGDIRDNNIKQAEIEGIYSTFQLINQDVNSYYSNFNGNLNEISMLTVQKAIIETNPKSGQTLVGYRITKQDGKYILYRKVKDNLTKNDGVKTQIIQADEIVFSFIDENLQEQLIWSAKSKKSAPVAWKITIKDKNSRVWERTMPFMVRFNNE